MNEDVRLKEESVFLHKELVQVFTVELHVSTQLLLSVSDLPIPHVGIENRSVNKQVLLDSSV